MQAYLLGVCAVRTPKEGHKGWMDGARSCRSIALIAGLADLFVAAG